MAKRRIYEIAKDKGMSSKELAEKLREAGFEVKNHLSSVDESAAEDALSPAMAPVEEKAADLEESAGQKAAGTGISAGRKADASSPPSSKKVKPKTGRKSGKDMPTVAAPDVPVRKGVKPSGKVYRKGEEAAALAEREQKAREAKREAAKKEAAKKEAAKKEAAKKEAAKKEAAKREAAQKDTGKVAKKPASGKGGKGGAETAPSRVPEIPTAPETGKGGKKKTGDRRESPKGQEKGSGTSSRSRGSRDKSGRRRVVIDSQAGRRGDKGGRKGARQAVSEQKEAAPVPEKPAPGVEEPVKLASGATVKDIAEALNVGSNEIIKTMMGLGEMATITQSLPEETVLILAEELGRKVEIESTEDEEAQRREFHDDPADLKERAPVVTVMGHVDHGKTSLLDAIRETEVTATEAGGITQHIGAYQVHHGDKAVTFIDTPGHEAFTAMRARGAEATDIVVVVVAANDGVMPQTIEAIDHAKEAGVPIVVAINKMDLENANPDRVKQQLADQGLVPEDWGGETVMVEVSAKQHMNLGELMDMLLLVAEVQEIQANPDAPASGVIVDAELDVGRGPVATMLVKRGTLHVGDSLVSGDSYGKVKAMFDFLGGSIRKAGPGVPAQILGFGAVPTAGEFVEAVEDERSARQMADKRAARIRMEEMAKGHGAVASLEDFFEKVQEGAVKELTLVVKADVDGSVEALEEALSSIEHPEVRVRVVHSGVGAINESDIMLAAASRAVVIGYNVRPSAAAKNLAENEGVEVRTHRVIYKATEEVEAALVGMLDPEKVEEEIGSAEVRELFRSSKFGTIAGCYVSEGKLTRSAQIRVIRDGSIVFEGAIGSLRRFSDDVKEVQAGYECGLRLEKFDDIREGDILEAYEVREVARTR